MSRRRRRTTEEDDLEEIRKGFEMFDVDKTGVINPEELLEVMDSMNLKEKNPFIYELIESLNSEKEFRKKGGVTLEELVNYVYSKVDDTESNIGIRQIFDVINDRDTDTVQMSTFYTLARDYGDQLSEDEIRYLLEKTQMGGEDLNFDEFYTIMKSSKGSGERNYDNNSSNNISLNKTSNKKKTNEIYNKKGVNSESLNSSNYSRKVRAKKYISDQPKDKEISNDHQEEQETIEKVITTTKTKNLRYSQNQNNEENNIPPENEEIQTEIKYEVQEEKEPQSNEPLSYSYKKVRIGAAPKYEKVVEKHVNVEEDFGGMDDNLNINQIVNDEDTKDGNYKKETQTKITRLPDGGKQIEITETTEVEVERPISRGSRYRYNKSSIEEGNNDDTNNESKGTYYRVRRPRGSESSSNTEEKRISISKVEVEENNDVIKPNRYQRRYRENKTSSNNI